LQNADQLKLDNNNARKNNMKLLIKTIATLSIILQTMISHADFYSALDAYDAKNYEIAYEEFKTLAEIGEKRAQFNLGIMYFQGQYVKKNVNKAYAWTKLGIDSDGSTEQEQNIHRLITNKVEDMTLAEAEYESLAASYADDMLLKRLYPILIDSDKTAFTDATPAKLIPPKYPLKLARKGVQGYVMFKLDIDRLGNPRNIRVVETFPKDAFKKTSLKTISKWRFNPAKDEKGKPVNSFDSSFRFVFRTSGKDIGVEKELYTRTRREAAGGSIKAQVSLGIWHKILDNLPGEENSNEWLLKAAKQGSLLAQYELGDSLLKGQNCISDTSKAVEWITRAAANGQTDAMNLLAALATRDSSLESQKQAIYYMSKVDKLSPSAILRLSWLLATSPYDQVADPTKALSLLSNIEWLEIEDDVTKREIQAAAYAALGDFRKAVDYQERALDEAKDLGFDVTELKTHLDQYKQNKKWF
jgi:uncharacterized protein